MKTWYSHMEKVLTEKSKAKLMKNMRGLADEADSLVGKFLVGKGIPPSMVGSDRLRPVVWLVIAEREPKGEYNHYASKGQSVHKGHPLVRAELGRARSRGDLGSIRLVIRMDGLSSAEARECIQHVREEVGPFLMDSLQAYNERSAAILALVTKLSCMSSPPPKEALPAELWEMLRPDVVPHEPEDAIAEGQEVLDLLKIGEPECKDVS